MFVPAFLVVLAASLLVVAAPSKHQHHELKWKDTKYLLAFGDSYTYVQGTLGHYNYTFIGDNLNLAYTPGQLLSDRIVQNQTATAEGGPNWVEYLTGCGLKPGLTNPRSCKRQLWDFAFGGADIGEDYLPLHHNYTVSLVTQISQYLTYGYPVLSEFVDPSKTRVAIWIGINDLNDSADLDIGDFPSFYDTIISTLFDSVRNIYDKGYKNFLFMNVPPIDRTPGNVGRNESDREPTALQIEEYNSALATHANAFSEANRDTDVRVYDTNALLTRVLDNPSEYGFANTTGYCPAYNQPDILTDPGKYGCVPQDRYFWFNNGHMTSHVHRILARELEAWLERS